ncbi:MAG: FCD domain-containing protein [Chloroflexus sp.]
MLKALYQTVRDQVSETQRQPILITDPERMRESIGEHRKIIAALSANDGLRAKHEMETISQHRPLRRTGALNALIRCWNGGAAQRLAIERSHFSAERVKTVIFALARGVSCRYETARATERRPM